MALLRFLKGNYNSLNNKAIVEGQVLICGDTGEMFVDVAADKRVKIGDFIVIDTLENLEKLDASAVPTSRLYYVEDGNILARSNGSSWIQINKQPTADQIKEMIGLGDYETKLNAASKLEAAKSYADSKIAEKVGDIEGTVKAYVDEKTTGIATSAALTELQGRVATAEGEIDALQEAVAEGGVVANAIAEAKKAGTDAQAAANTAHGEIDALKTAVAEYKTANDAAVAAAQAQADKGVADAAEAKGVADSALELAGTKATMAEVNDAIANAGRAVKADVDQAIADLDAAYKKADSDLETKLQGNIDKKVDKTTYDEKMTALANEDTRLAGLITDMDAAYKQADTDIIARVASLESDITGLSGAMHFKGIVEALPETTEGYADGDTVICGNKEFVVHGENFVELGDVSAEVQRISDLEGIVGHAANGENAATGLVKDVADNTAAIALAETKADATAKFDELKDYVDAKAVHADWNENDETSPAYIENRPFYTISEGSENVIFDEVIPAEDVNQSDENRYGTSYKYRPTKNYDTSMMYTVIIDGVTYDNVPCANNYYNYIGDYNLINYPFCSFENGTINFSFTTGGSHSVKIIEKISGEVVQIDEKYIPATIARSTKVDAIDQRVVQNSNQLSFLGGKISVNEEAIANLEAADDAIIERVAAVEAKFSDGEGSVSDLIAEAKAEIEAQIAAALDAAKADASNKDAVVLAEAQKGITAAQEDLQSKIDAVSGALSTYKTENDAAVALKADASVVYTKAEIEAMFSWSDF